MRFGIVLATLLGALSVPGPLAAQDVTVRVNVSTLNDLATRLGPLGASGSYKFRKWGFTVFECPWTVNLGAPTFTIDQSGVHASGSGSATFCWLTLPLSYQTNGQIVAEGLRAIRASFGSFTVSPRFCLPLLPCVSPFSRDVSSSINIPALPIEVAAFHFETARGPRNLRVSPRSLDIVNGNGFIELRSNVALW